MKTKPFIPTFKVIFSIIYKLYFFSASWVWTMEPEEGTVRLQDYWARFEKRHKSELP